MRHCAGIAQFCHIIFPDFENHIIRLYPGILCRRIVADRYHLEVAVLILLHGYADADGLPCLICLIGAVLLVCHILGIRIVQTGNIAFHCALHHVVFVHIRIVVLLDSFRQLIQFPVCVLAAVAPIDPHTCSGSKNTAQTEQQNQCGFPHRDSVVFLTGLKAFVLFLFHMTSPFFPKKAEGPN